ncbi:MAG TPA: hypothetical protein ENI99_05720, partial [Sedimenticola sp.]|nr:hypothetical protein [Sedimenticola sp.]
MIMESQAFSGSQAVWCFKKEDVVNTSCETQEATRGKSLNYLSRFTALLIFAVFFSLQITHAATPETTVACVEGAEPLALAFGDSATGCAIDTGADTDTFEFTGNVGGEIRLNLRTLTKNLDPNMSLRDPNGVEVATKACVADSWSTCGFALSHTLTVAGTYLVTIGETGLDNAGNYNLQLEKLYPAIVPVGLEYDVAVADTLSPGTDMDFF